MLIPKQRTFCLWLFKLNLNPNSILQYKLESYSLNIRILMKHNHALCKMGFEYFYNCSNHPCKYQLTSRRQIWIWKGDKDKKGSMCCHGHIKDSIVNLLQFNTVVREELQSLLNVCELFIGVFILKSWTTAWLFSH